MQSTSFTDDQAIWNGVRALDQNKTVYIYIQVWQ